MENRLADASHIIIASYSIFSSFLITLIDKGSTYMSSTAGVQAEIADVITGVILLFCACTAYIKYRVARMEEKEENR